MRTAFIKTLTHLAEKNPRIMLLVGDLGFGVVTEFASRFPKQFLNVGVAEQNMAGIATGLALCGKTVFTYSIANFPILRCLEQIRNDICYHKANVISVSVGGGFSYGALGMTHHGTEDLAIMRTLPNMKVLAPGDPLETESATKYIASGVGPVYLRLGRAGEPQLYPNAPNWEIGKAIEVKSGQDLTLISTGAMLQTTLEAALNLKKSGIQARVLSMHTLKPIDKEAILKAAIETQKIITVEEHSHIGGLGSAVAEVLSQENILNIQFKMIATPSEYSKYIGNQEFIRKKYNLDTDSIVQQAKLLNSKVSNYG